MKTGKVLFFVFVAFLIFVGLGTTTSLVAGQVGQQDVYLRLQAATFDPLQGEPLLPDTLRQEAVPEGAPGAYIVQFHGPVQESWKAQVEAQGGRLLGYLPDYAFVVWMDGAASQRVAGLDAVRWVGVVHPAYKLSPNLATVKTTLRKVLLYPGADLQAVEGRLKTINSPAAEVPGEQFVLALPAGGEQALAAWPEVQWIEPYQIPEAFNDVGGGIMGESTAWASNLTGSGMIVTVADTGVDSGVDAAASGDMHADFDNRLAHISSWPVPNNPSCWSNGGADDSAKDQASGHGTHVLGSVAGNGAASSGQIKGLAYQATLTFQAVEQYVNFTPACEGYPNGYVDGYYLVGLPNDLNTLFQEAYNWGARIHSNSWGSNDQGAYPVESQDVDEFVWAHPDMVILFAAGNAGTDANDDGYVDEGSVGSPATAKNAITSGASDNERATGGLAAYSWASLWSVDYGANPTGGDLTSDNRQELAAFSSRGPVDDGRIKPDLVAPGTNILSTRSGSISISSNGWGPYSNPKYMYFGGTSMATPLIAGAATLVREYYVEQRGVAAPSAALIKATLINSATDITGYGNTAQEAGKPIPNNHEGWGLVNVGAATTGQRDFLDGVSVTPNQVLSYDFQVSSTSKPLKVTLVWSDPPPSSLSGKQLVNNLDLRVIAPDGSTAYLGNRFSGGWSVTGGTADNTNNVENVYIQSPVVGSWSVQVSGQNVPQGPQPYALVVTGGSRNLGLTPRIFAPMLIRQPAPTPTPTPPVPGPVPGYWQKVDRNIEFYVTADRLWVDNFRIYVTACNTIYQITDPTPVAITKTSTGVYKFTRTGSYYFNGIFDTSTTAHGQAGLKSFSIPGCGTVKGGPWNWTASWVNGNPPPPLAALEVIPQAAPGAPGFDAWKE